MAKFILSIETTDVAELQRIVARMPADADESPIPAAEPVVTNTPRAGESVEQTAARTRRGRPPKSEAQAEAAPVPTTAAPAAEAPSTPAAGPGPTNAAPVATAPSVSPGHPAEPPVSYDALKSLLMQLMEKKSASFAQGVLRERCGVPSLSQLKQESYFAAYQALEQALQS